MELTVRGWGKDHGQKEIVKRDLATAKVGGFDTYWRSETYITPKLPMERQSAFSRGRGSNEEPTIEIRLDAKIVLNGDYLVRLAFNRKEIASLFFLLYADCPLEDMMDHFIALRSLHERGPLPQLPFAPVMLKKVDELEISVRSANCLKNDNIVYVGDLVQKTKFELLRTPNFGRKSVSEIEGVLAQMDLHLGMQLPGWPPENIEELAQRFEDLKQD